MWGWVPGGCVIFGIFCALLGVVEVLCIRCTLFVLCLLFGVFCVDARFTGFVGVL